MYILQTLLLLPPPSLVHYILCIHCSLYELWINYFWSPVTSPQAAAVCAIHNVTRLKIEQLEEEEEEEENISTKMNMMR